MQLLQIETVQGRAEPNQNPEMQPTMDDLPTHANPKFPPFRRASLHFVGKLVRAYTRRAHEGEQAPDPFDNSLKKHMLTTLNYVAATDADVVVRVMAREVIEALHGLNRARLGL